MPVELTFVLKDEERKLSKSFHVYESFCLHEKDENIAKCLKEALDEFKGVPDDIKVKATMVLR